MRIIRKLVTLERDGVVCQFRVYGPQHVEYQQTDKHNLITTTNAANAKEKIKKMKKEGWNAVADPMTLP